MVSQPASYADRAKTSRPPITTKSPSNNQTLPTTQAAPDAPSPTASVLAPNPSSETPRGQMTTPSVPAAAVNGINSASVVASSASASGEGDQALPSNSDAPVVNTPTVNGHSTPSSVSSQSKQNVWAVRKEQQMTASRTSSATPSQPRSAAPSQLNSRPPSGPPHTPQVAQSSASAANATPNQDLTQTRESTSRPAKKKPSKLNSTTPLSNVAPAAVPDMAGLADWPAPIDATAVPATATTAASSRRGSYGAHADEGGQTNERAHSRESSGTSGQGKKKQWIAIPAAELQAAADAASTVRPSSPRQGAGGRGRRIGGVEDRRNGGTMALGAGRSSSHTSKRSSAAPSPLKSHVPLAGMGHAHQGPIVNLPSSSLRMPGHLNAPPHVPGQGSGIRSHPHSPLTRSPYLSSQSHSRHNSPRMGGGAYSPGGLPFQINYHPQQQLRHPLPPNPSHPPQTLVQQPPPRKKIPRPSPAKSGAVGGVIPDVPISDHGFRPVFGSTEADSEGGLGLTVDETDKSSGRITSDAVGLAEPPEENGIVRWHEKERAETEPERILKAEGRYGIGVTSDRSVKDVKEASTQPDGTKQDALGGNTDGENGVVVAATEQQPPAVGGTEPSLSPRWLFGSLHGLSSGPSPIRSRIPSNSDGSNAPSGYTDNNGLNGYGYDGRGMAGSPSVPRHYSDERRGHYPDGNQYSYPPYEGANGYAGRAPNGRRPGRGFRGGAAYGGPRGVGGYAQRPLVQGHGPYKGSSYAPPQGPHPAAAYPSPVHTHQPPYDPMMPGNYPPPMFPPVDYQLMDPYGPQTSVPPPTPGGSHPSLSTSENPYSPVAHPSAYPPYMYGPPPPTGYYAPYPYMVPYAPPGPVNAIPYSVPSAYPPPGPPTNATPPMPMPLTSPGYTLDPGRFYLLGQVEYYFSVQNFLSDVFLRRQMDSEGWIDINVIASFPRVRQLTQDASLVRDVMTLSAYIEVSPDGVKCRMKNRQWEPFVLPGAPPHMSAQFTSQPQYEAQLGNADATRGASEGFADRGGAFAADRHGGDKQVERDPGSTAKAGVGEDPLTIAV